VALAEDVIEALAAWPGRVESVRALGEGWNSGTWLVVTADGQRFVAKLADHLDAEALDGSLRVAEFAAAQGLACGDPLRTRDGELLVLLREGVLAVLRYVPGKPPDLSAPDQVRRAGRVLARTHMILQDYPAGDEPRYRWPWEWVTRCLDSIAMPADINAAARQAWREIVRTVSDHRLSVSVIHADPGPEGFLLGDGDGDGDGDRDGLIDWATTLRGPLLYDLASFAVLARSAGPGAARWFTEGYVQEMPRIGPEFAYLDCMVRARWVAHAIYFASRIERGISRGNTSPAANEDGLAAAYRGLA
jgi:Ser/Thr protein kinase RdoA (MazF antagonist)